MFLIDLLNDDIVQIITVSDLIKDRLNNHLKKYLSQKLDIEHRVFFFIQIISNLIEQFNFWCMNLRTKSTFEFDHDENNHRCKVNPNRKML